MVGYLGPISVKTKKKIVLSPWILYLSLHRKKVDLYFESKLFHSNMKKIFVRVK